MITAVKLYILCESYYRLTKTNVFYLVINCLLYTSDAADDMQCVDLGGRRIIKKMN